MTPGLYCGKGLLFVLGTAASADIIHAVEDAGYGASLKGTGSSAQKKSAGYAEQEEALKDHETPKLRKQMPVRKAGMAEHSRRSAPENVCSIICRAE